MRVESVATLVQVLRENGLLEPLQLDELAHTLQDRFTEPRALATELIKRGWLTAYQAAQVLRGRGPYLVLGPYLILEHLGRGGMGQVYKARHRLMNRVVALKVIHKGAACQPDRLSRFQQEVRASAQMSHPNIVLAHDAAQIGELYFLVMEYVEGSDLGRLVRQRGPLPVAQACEYIRQAALGLQHAHERGLVHRDIKPTNLLLTTKDAVVKILDLGIARLAEAPVKPAGAGPAGPEPAAPPSGEGQGLTQWGTLMGTPDYIAPEQAADPRQADTRADIYALGCTFYFLLTGRPPFPEGSQSDKLLCQQRTEPPEVRGVRPEVPEEVAAVLRTMMAKRPVDRFQSPAGVVAALEPFAVPGQPEDGLLMTLEDEDYPGVDPTQVTVVAPSAPAAPTSPGGPKRGFLSALRHRLATPPPAGVALGIASLVLLVGVFSFLLLFPGKPPADPVKVPPLPRHEGIVRGVAFSPDGRLVASGGGDNVVRVWDARTLAPRAVLSGHGDSISAVLFAPDSRHVFSGSSDNTLRQWDLDSGREVRCFQGHSWLVEAVALSGDGRRVLTGSADKTMWLWDVATGAKRTHFAAAGPVLGVALTVDGARALSGEQGGDVLLWDTASGRKLGRFAGHGDAVWGVAFSPDGRRVVSGSEDHTVRVWDVSTRKEVRRFEGHKAAVLGVAFSPDGQRVLSGGADHTVRLGDVGTGLEVRCFEGHTDWVRSVAFSADGRRAVSGGRDQTVRLWSLPD